MRSAMFLRGRKRKIRGGGKRERENVFEFDRVETQDDLSSHNFRKTILANIFRPSQLNTSAVTPFLSKG